MKKLILTNFQAPGDILMLTAAVRDLHRCHPNRFLTDVRTSCPELWENNPYLTPLRESDPEVRTIDCGYPLIHQADGKALHFIHGFMEFLSAELGFRIQPTEFKADIHLSESERRRASLVRERCGLDVPFWIVVAGGKFDYTIKWWHFRRWQAVVDHFHGRLLFAQVGKADDYHPPLRNVLDLRRQTSLRDMVVLMHQAQGVICPVTFHMHLSAAVEMRGDPSGTRPCVVVAGGRESPHWEAYPTHQFVHTVGALPCCRRTGCWRSRTVPLKDGDDKDGERHLCVDVVNGLPRCMDMISPAHVIERVEYYLQGRATGCLTERQWGAVGASVGRSRSSPGDPLGATAAEEREGDPVPGRGGSRNHNRMFTHNMKE